MADTGLKTPTLAALIDRISSDWNTRFGNKQAYDARVPMTPSWAIVRVMAGVAFLLYGFAIAIANQVLPTTCNETFLGYHAAIWGVTRELPVQAQGGVLFTGTATSAIPAGTRVQRGDGAAYMTNADAVVGGGGTVTVACTAVVAGAAGNCAGGTLLTLASPVAGVQSACTAANPDGFQGGLGLELVDDWRQRIVDRIRLLAQGGSIADYTIWTEGTTGVSVSKVWPLPHTPNAGDVTVYFLVTGSGSGRIPSGGNVAAVVSQLAALRPVNDVVHVRAPTDDAVPLTIAGINPNTTGMKAAVVSGMTAMFDRYATLGGTITNSTLRTAIGNTPGILSFTLTAVDGGGEDADIVAGAGEVSRLGTITWT